MFARRPLDSHKSAFFHEFRDRLIQQQYLSDREQQWRIEHESALGAFARLPLEVRCLVYRRCFPLECLEDDLAGPSERGSGLLCLMRTTRSIYEEIKPLLERHAQVRLFNLVLGNKGVRFENKRFDVDYMTPQNLQSMTSETIAPLGIFARTLPRIRNLRLAVQVDRVVAPAGLVPPLEPFAMWVFSLICRGEMLQNLVVDFHLSHSFPVDALANEDGSVMSIERLMHVLLGAKTATHCQTVLQQALTSELQVVRFIVNQKSENGQKSRRIRSWRWVRPSRSGQAGPYKPESTDANPMPVQAQQPRPAAPLVDSSGSPEYSPPPASISPEKPTIPTSERTMSPARPPASPEYSPPSPQPGKANIETVEPPASPEYSPPPLSRENLIEPAKLPSSGDVSDETSRLSSPVTRKPTMRGESIDLTGEEDDMLEMQVMTPKLNPTLFDKSPSSSPQHLNDEDKMQVDDDSIFFDSDISRPGKQLKHRRRKEKRSPKHDSINASKSSTPRPQPKVQNESFKKRDPSRSSPAKMLVDSDVDDAEDVYVVERLYKTKLINGVPYIKVKWKGYAETTWEPRSQLLEDVPEIVRACEKARGLGGMGWKTGRVHMPPDQKATASLVGALNSEAPRIDTQRAKSRLDPEMAVAEPRKPQAEHLPRKTQERVTQTSSRVSIRNTPPKSSSQAPKRPLTAAFLYMKAHRPTIAADMCSRLGNPSLVQEAQIANEGTRRWLAMDAGQRAIWERLHATRIAVYHVQMEAYKAGRPVPSQEEVRRLAAGIGTVDFMDLT